MLMPDDDDQWLWNYYCEKKFYIEPKNFSVFRMIGGWMIHY